MKPKILPFVLAILALPLVGSAATGVFGSYAEIFTTSSTVYVGQSYSGSNPAFNGADLGIFSLSDTLEITNASLLTFKNGGGDVTGAELQYRVYETGDTPGGFTTISLNFGSNAPATDLGGNNFGGGGDQEWRGFGGGPIDLLGGITGNGDYEVEIFYRAFTNEGDRLSDNGGANYKASFSVVPEPAVALLGSIGLLILLGRRK
jgi:hypothetical protein